MNTVWEVTSLWARHMSPPPTWGEERLRDEPKERQRRTRRLYGKQLAIGRSLL